MIRIAAVDDEIHVLERFERLVSEFKELELCGLFDSGEQLLIYIKEHPADAVFLDIEMPGVNGLQLSAQILDMHSDIDIIFVTAFNQYAVEAFELQAIDYIMKPLTKERLGKTVGRLQKKDKTVSHYEKPYIQCFGDFQVFLSDEALTWKNSKAKEILALLVHQKGVPVNWEKIANAVWPDYNYEKAQTNFHATMYLLRKRLVEAGLPQILENARGNYRIVTAQVDSDIYQLEEMVKSNQIKSKECIQLIRRLEQSGYMEGNGYAWAQPRAAELDLMCQKVRRDLKISK